MPSSPPTMILIRNNNYVYTKTYDAVYEHTAENAEKLAEKIASFDEDIADIEEQIEAKKEEIAELEAKIAAVNVESIEREATLAKAEADKKLKEYNDVLATQAYKDKVAALEKAVADAQAAFNANPTSFTEYQYNEDGTPKEDANGNQEVKYGTKELLQQAEAALSNVVENKIYNYGTEAEPKWLYNLYNELYNSDQYASVEWDGWTQGFWSPEGLVGLAEHLAEQVEYFKEGLNNDLEAKNDELEELNADIEDIKENIEEYKELQAMLAPTSDEMKEYVALCEKRAELQKADFECNIQLNVISAKINYYNNLVSTLDMFVNDQWQGIYNYAELIEAAEKAIKEAKEAIAELEYNGQGKLTKEAAIAKKEAEIAAIEAELKIRQAEFEAELAELEALVDVEEEEEVPAE